MKSLGPVMLGVAFPVVWTTVLMLLSRIGGWAALAARYPDDRRERGATYRLRTVAVGAVNYGSCVTLRVCESGLGISVMFPFRIGHRPLFIPWGQFHGAVVTRRWLFIPFIDASIGRPVVANVSLPTWLREHLPPGSWRSAEQGDPTDRR